MVMNTYVVLKIKLFPFAGTMGIDMQTPDNPDLKLLYRVDWLMRSLGGEEILRTIRVENQFGVMVDTLKRDWKSGPVFQIPE